MSVAFDLALPEKNVTKDQTNTSSGPITPGCARPALSEMPSYPPLFQSSPIFQSSANILPFLKDVSNCQAHNEVSLL